MAPTPPRNPPSRTDETDETGERVECKICVGVSVYKKAMMESRASPECRGVEFSGLATRGKMDELRDVAGKTRHDNFTLYGLGLTIYGPDWMQQADRLPVIKGLGFMVVQSDPEELMRRMEEHKRIKRELRRRRRGAVDGEGDDDDDDTLEDDDDVDDLVEDLGDDDADRHDGSALLEKGPLGSMPSKPRLPPILPTMTFEEFVGKSVENAKTMTYAMYNFWAKRLDGFGDRYEDSCRRIVAQMEKQVLAVPHSIMWAKNKIKELSDQAKGGRGGGGTSV